MNVFSCPLGTNFTNFQQKISSDASCGMSQTLGIKNLNIFPLLQHVETAQKLLHPGERPPMAGLSSHVEKKRDVRKQINHHLHMILTEFSYALEDLEIYFSLFSNKENCYVSEKVTLAVITDSELQNDPKGAIFMDVGTLDQIRDLYLICHVIKKNTKSTGFGTNRYIQLDLYYELIHLNSTFTLTMSQFFCRNFLKSTSIKKTTSWTPFLGGSAVLEVIFLNFNIIYLFKIIWDRLQIISTYTLNMDTKNLFPKY